MSFFDQPLPQLCRRSPYEHDVAGKWTDQIAASDGFVFVTPVRASFWRRISHASWRLQLDRNPVLSCFERVSSAMQRQRLLR